MLRLIISMHFMFLVVLFACTKTPSVTCEISYQEENIVFVLHNGTNEDIQLNGPKGTYHLEQFELVYKSVDGDSSIYEGQIPKMVFATILDTKIIKPNESIKFKLNLCKGFKFCDNKGGTIHINFYNGTNIRCSSNSLKLKGS